VRFPELCLEGGSVQRASGTLAERIIVCRSDRFRACRGRFVNEIKMCNACIMQQLSTATPIQQPHRAETSKLRALVGPGGPTSRLRRHATKRSAGVRGSPSAPPCIPLCFGIPLCFDIQPTTAASPTNFALMPPSLGVKLMVKPDQARGRGADAQRASMLFSACASFSEMRPSL